MLFVAQLKVMPGQLEEATRLFKRPRLPNNVMVHEFLAMLGQPDASTAADFVTQFGHVAETITSLALPIEELKWTSQA